MLPEKRNSARSGRLERAKARKRLGLKGDDFFATPKKRGPSKQRLRLIKMSEVVEQIAREGKIPPGRESLMLSSAPAELVTQQKKEQQEVKASGPLRRGESVLVRIKTRAGFAAEHVAEVIELTGQDRVTLVRPGGMKMVVDLVHVRRNAPGTSYGIAKNDSRKADAHVSKIKPPPHFANGGQVQEEELFSSFLARAQRDGFPLPVLAKILRLEPVAVRALQEKDLVPTDDTVQRLVDLCNLEGEFDRVMSAVERTKKKKESEASAAELTVIASNNSKALSFEEFGERLSLLCCPVPFNSDKRSQWDTAARILFEIYQRRGS